MMFILELSRRYCESGTACRIRRKGIERFFARMKSTIDNSNLAISLLIVIFGRALVRSPAKSSGASAQYKTCERQEKVNEA